jgi:hypothetical protein
MKAARCPDCGARLTPNHRGHLHCARCLHERVAARRKAQGLPERIEDPSALAFVAGIVESGLEANAAQTRDGPGAR